MMGTGGKDNSSIYLQEVPLSQALRGDEHKLKHSKFHLNMRKSFFTLRVMEHWNRLPRGVVEPPSLEIFKTHLGVVLCSLLWVNFLWQEGVD